jgi:hypothetical protein
MSTTVFNARYNSRQKRCRAHRHQLPRRRAGRTGRCRRGSHRSARPAAGVLTAAEGHCRRLPAQECALYGLAGDDGAEVQAAPTERDEQGLTALARYRQRHGRGFPRSLTACAECTSIRSLSEREDRQPDTQARYARSDCLLVTVAGDFDRKRAATKSEAVRGIVDYRQRAAFTVDKVRLLNRVSR